jgi:hypothetical protein
MCLSSGPWRRGASSPQPVLTKLHSPATLALLLAGARPARVPAALLLPGRGLAGGGPAPRDDQALEIQSADALRMLAAREAGERPSFDPMLLACESDPRPPDYARHYADAASRLLLAEDGGARPPWWESARGTAHAEDAPADAAAGLKQLLGGSQASVQGDRNGVE